MARKDPRRKAGNSPAADLSASEMRDLRITAPEEKSGRPVCLSRSDSLRLTADLAPGLRDLFRGNIGIVRSAGVLRQALDHSRHHPFHCPECGHGQHPRARRPGFPVWDMLFGDWPYALPFTQSMLRALCHAEGAFVRDYCVQRSHEERLTGHLVSGLSDALFLTKSLVERVGRRCFGEPVTIQVAYRDLSALREEGRTGADLGLAVEVDLPDRPRRTAVAIFQAKKMNGSARIDVGQCKTLMAGAKEGAFYLFYDVEGRGGYAPIVMDAAHVLQEIKGKEAGPATRSLSRDRVTSASWSGTLPVSVFLLFNLIGLETDTPSGLAVRDWGEARGLLSPHRQQEDDFGSVYHIARVRLGSAAPAGGEAGWPAMPDLAG